MCVCVKSEHEITKILSLQFLIHAGDAIIGNFIHPNPVVMDQQQYFSFC